MSSKDKKVAWTDEVTQKNETDFQHAEKMGIFVSSLLDLPKDLKEGETVIGNLKARLDKISFPHITYDGKSQKKYEKRIELLEAPTEKKNISLRISHVRINQRWVLLLELTRPTVFFCGPNRKCMYEGCEEISLEISGYCEHHKNLSKNFTLDETELVKKIGAPVSFFEKEKYLQLEIEKK